MIRRKRSNPTGEPLVEGVNDRSYQVVEETFLPKGHTGRRLSGQPHVVPEIARQDLESYCNFRARNR